MRDADIVHAPVVRSITENPDIVPGTFSVEWVNGASTYAVTDEDADGELTGTGGTGAVDYRTGKWWVLPTTLPNINTEFAINYYYGDTANKIVDTFDSPALDTAGNIAVVLSEKPKANTVVVRVPFDTIDYYGESGESPTPPPPSVNTYDPPTSEVTDLLPPTIPPPPATFNNSYKIEIDWLFYNSVA